MAAEGQRGWCHEGSACELHTHARAHLQTVAPGSDVRRDLPRYRVWRHGELADEVDDVSHLWAHQRGGGAAAAASPRVPAAHPDARSDWVTFLLGCSFSFEDALQRAGLPVRHLQEEKGGRPVDAGSPPPPVAHAAADAKNVPMFTTALECASAGAFRGPLVVSMRPMTPAQVGLAPYLVLLLLTSSLRPWLRRRSWLTASRPPSRGCTAAPCTQGPPPRWALQTSAGPTTATP